MLAKFSSQQACLHLNACAATCRAETTGRCSLSVQEDVPHIKTLLLLTDTRARIVRGHQGAL